MSGHYEGDGRLTMAQALADKHPDVARVSHKWGRAQHHVDYSRFRRNQLIRRPDCPVHEGINEYGMVLEECIDDKWTKRNPYS